MGVTKKAKMPGFVGEAAMFISSAVATITQP